MKQKLLLAAAIMPFPKISGGAIRIFNTIKYLSEKYEIYFVGWQDSKKQLSEMEKKWLDTHTKMWTIFPLWYKQKLSWLSYGQPYYFNEWFNPEAGYVINTLIKEQQIKKVQVEFTQLLYLRDYLPSGIKTVFVAHDISSISFERRRQEAALYKKPLLWWRWLGIHLYEKKYLPAFDTVVAMSDEDQKILIQQYKVPRSIVIASGIENIEILAKVQNDTINLGYIGGFTHTPNARAVEYFITKIAPRLEKEKVNYRYYIAGENSQRLIEEWIKKANINEPERIINLGRVKESRDFYSKIDTLVVTLFSGSGTRIKVIEALGFGRKIISTSVGAEGIKTKEYNIVSADTPKTIVEEIKKSKDRQLNIDRTKLEQLTWRNVWRDYDRMVL